MHTTPVSLLLLLRQPDQHQAWSRFGELYTPLLYRWALRVSSRPEDAADLVQDVFVILMRRLPEFVYEPGKSFRAWLWTVVRNAWRTRVRQAASRPRTAEGIDTDKLFAPDEVSELEEKEYRQYLIGRALQLIRADFEPVTWQAFQEYAIGERSAAEVAAELGLSVNSVYLARSRVLRRLRAELEGLLD